MSKTWFISDTHFNHKNIIDYCNRPFNDVDEMNEHIINQWNSVVKSDDTVWFLGDFALGNRELCRKLAAQLNGHKKIVRGNHDNWSDEFYRSIGFEYVSKYPVLLKGKFLLSHAPLQTQCGEIFNIYGHVHTHKDYEDLTENSCCVCVERWNYTPISLKVFNDYQEQELHL